MGTLHEEFWLSEGTGHTRTERKSGKYEYYLPTLLCDLKLYLEPDVVGDVTRAENAIVRLNENASTLHSSEGIARLLLRAEAVSSSFIEGLSVGTKRLLKAEMNLANNNTFKHDGVAAEIVGNIHAMEKAITDAQSNANITTNTVLGVHKTLCKDTRLESYGGLIRKEQNWIGGNSYNPLSAEFIPPEPSRIPKLLADLALFSNDTTISPVVQAAIVHAQFETIHPFVDGNGRAGRTLIHLILRRRGLTPNLVPPISLIMATHSKSYVQGLTSYRFLDSDSKDAIQNGLNEWISFFAGACLRACEEAHSFEKNAFQLQESWRAKLAPIRKNSALDLLLDKLVGIPLFTVASAANTTGRAISAIAPAIERCIEAGIVKPLNNQKRNRAFEVPEVIRSFNIFERELASPTGNTKTAKPARPVPGKHLDT